MSALDCVHKTSSGVEDPAAYLVEVVNLPGRVSGEYLASLLQRLKGTSCWMSMLLIAAAQKPAMPADLPGYLRDMPTMLQC